MAKAKRDEVEKEVRTLGAETDTRVKFMTMIDAQHADIAAYFARILAARAERSAAYDKCAALLVKEFGSYKITNGQFIFRAQSTADGYNAAAAAMAAAAKRIGELDEEGAALKQVQLKRWKEFRRNIDLPANCCRRSPDAARRRHIFAADALLIRVH